MHTHFATCCTNYPPKMKNDFMVFNMKSYIVHHIYGIYNLAIVLCGSCLSFSLWFTAPTYCSNTPNLKNWSLLKLRPIGGVGWGGWGPNKLRHQSTFLWTWSLTNQFSVNRAQIGTCDGIATDSINNTLHIKWMWCVVC